MKVVFIEKTNQYSAAFQDNHLFEIVKLESAALLTFHDIDALVITEEAVPIHELADKVDVIKDYPQVFYLMKENNATTEGLCHANRIIPFIEKEMGAAVITETIKKILYPDTSNHNRLFLFFGADSKAGTTSVVHAVANRLTTIANKKVLVVSLSGRPNDTFFEFSKSSVDTLSAEISSGIVTFADVIKESEKVGNYLFLAGPRNLIQAQNYEVNDFIGFIDVLRNQEDYLILIDGGGEIFNMLVIAALQQTHNRFLVIKHAESYYRQLERYFDQILSKHAALNLNYQSFQYVLTHYDNDIDTPVKLREKQGVILGKVPYSFYGRTAENTFNALHKLDDEFAAAVEPVAEFIAVKSGTKLNITAEKKSFLQKIFPRLGGTVNA